MSYPKESASMKKKCAPMKKMMDEEECKPRKMMGGSLPSILLVYISFFLLLELIKMGKPPHFGERKRLMVSIVAGERSPRIIKYNK